MGWHLAVVDALPWEVLRQANFRVLFSSIDYEDRLGGAQKQNRVLKKDALLNICLIRTAM